MPYNFEPISKRYTTFGIPIKRLAPFPPHLKPFPHLKKHIFKCPIQEEDKLSYLLNNSIIFHSLDIMFNIAKFFVILYIKIEKSFGKNPNETNSILVTF